MRALVSGLIANSFFDQRAVNRHLQGREVFGDTLKHPMLYLRGRPSEKEPHFEGLST